LGEDGGTLIETTLALPVLLGVIFCFMEVCTAFYSYNMISEAAREGTRYAMMHGATCPTSTSPTCEATASQVNAYVSGLNWVTANGGTMTVNTTYPDGNETPGSRVQVQVTYVLPINMPFVPRAAMTMHSTSLAYILQ
jgi:Flp pilus assembly protein TadG